MNPVWAAGATGGIQHLAVVDGISELCILGDEGRCRLRETQARCWLPREVLFPPPNYKTGLNIRLTNSGVLQMNNENDFKRLGMLPRGATNMAFATNMALLISRAASYSFDGTRQLSA
jgi:hypothetical protein